MCMSSAAGTYQDLAGNVGVADLSTSLPIGVLSSTASTNSTASSSGATLTPGTIVVIVLANIVGLFLLIWLCILVSQLDSLQSHHQ